MKNNTEHPNETYANQTALMQAYQSLESQWAQSNDYLTNLKLGRFDDTATTLWAEIDRIKTRLETYEEQMAAGRIQMQEFEDDSDFIKLYNEKNTNTDSFYFSAFEVVSGFKGSFLQYKNNADELLKLTPLVENLKQQVEEKEKIRNFLYACSYDENKFGQFVDEYIKSNTDKKVSKWSQLRMIIVGQGVIMGFPEDAYHTYNAILEEHYTKANEIYRKMRDECLEKTEIYEQLQRKQLGISTNGFLERYKEKKNSKGIIVFTARDYVSGFRKKALAYKNLIDQNALNQENCTIAKDNLRQTQGALHIRQSEIEVLYASLIQEIEGKVANLAAQKRFAFKQWSEYKSREQHPDQMPKNLFKI